jgi:hypothetical protein
MKIRNFTYSFALLALVAFAGTASAQSGTAPQLLMSSNVVTAMELNIETHSSGLNVGGSAGSFDIDFDDIDGLGLAGASADVTVTKSSTGALYLTPINVVPKFSGYVDETATVSVDTVLDVAGLAREGAASNSNATIATSRQAFDNAANNSENVRYVGFFIARTTAIGAKAATLVYTITMVDETP